MTAAGTAALSRARDLLAAYPELAAVLVAAAVGLSVRRPLAWLTAHQGINVLLAVLVLATAVTIDPAALRCLVPATRRRLATDRAAAAAARTAMIAVAALVALVAAEVRLSAGYAAVAAALVLFLLAAAVAGRLLGAGSARGTRSALLLTTSMRDFAIAAGPGHPG